MNGFANNGEPDADGSAKEMERTLTRSATAGERPDASPGFGATCKRVASAFERRFKRECEEAEPVSTLVDHSTLTLASAVAIFWAFAIFSLANEPDWRWENVSEASVPNSLIWVAFGAAAMLAALLSLASRAVWTVALLCRKKGVQATLFFWAGLIAFGVALAEGAWLTAALWPK